MVTQDDVYAFICRNDMGVVSTVSADGGPEAALVYVAAAPNLDLLFYTLQANRKCANLRRHPRVAFVIGLAGKETLQYEGIAAEVPTGDLTAVRAEYLKRFPDAAGRVVWPGVTFFRVRAKWLRYSSYGSPWQLEEFVFA